MLGPRHRFSTSAFAALFVGLTASACTRDAEEEICPALEEGDLVITEIRGPQSGNDTFGQWFEVFNGSGRDLQPLGLQLHMRKLDGGSFARLIVRADARPMMSGQYYVLGHHGPEESDVPEFVDFTFFSDFSKPPRPPESDGTGDTGDTGDISEEPGPRTERELYSSGIVELVSCGVVIDEVIYERLPSDGSWSLNGAEEPTTKFNDNRSEWCADDTPQSEDDPSNLIGTPGTPGEENRPCDAL